MIEFTLPPVQLLTMLAGVILPLIVGLVTTRVTSAGLKAVLLAALALVSQLATELVASINAGTPYDLGTALILGLGTFLIATGTHYGFWKPTGTSARAQDSGPIKAKGRHEA